MVEDLTGHSAAAHLRLGIHPLDLDGARVPPSQGSAADGLTIRPRDDECADPGRDMLRLQMRPKPVLGRVAAGQVRIERSDQAARIG
jgi:hypothetical protein